MTFGRVPIGGGGAESRPTDLSGSLQFQVGLDLENGTKFEVVNRYNRDYRYASAYLDDENDPYLQYDFEVLHTQHEAHVVSQIDVWSELLDAFLRATGYRDDGSSDAQEDGTQGEVRFDRRRLGFNPACGDPLGATGYTHGARRRRKPLYRRARRPDLRPPRGAEHDLDRASVVLLHDSPRAASSNGAISCGAGAATASSSLTPARLWSVSIARATAACEASS